MSGRLKIIALNQENKSLRELRNALMADNRRLEFERDNAELRADILDQGMMRALKERDEARMWAICMKRERDKFERILNSEGRIIIRYVLLGGKHD